MRNVFCEAVHNQVERQANSITIATEFSSFLPLSARLKLVQGGSARGINSSGDVWNPWPQSIGFHLRAIESMETATHDLEVMLGRVRQPGRAELFPLDKARHLTPGTTTTPPQLLLLKLKAA